jgi:carbonic anhydrase
MKTFLAIYVLSPAARVHYDISPSTFFLLWFGILALITGILLAKFREVRKRRDALTQFALENGFTFAPKPDADLATELAEIRVPSAGFGINARFSNILRGSRANSEIVIADRTVGSGKSQSTSTVIAFRFDKNFPSFMVCNENFLWRLADKVGYRDIDLENAPEFSRRFFLHGDDEIAVRALFAPDVVQAFQGLESNSNFNLSASGKWLVVSRPGRIFAVEQIRDALTQTEAVVTAFRSKRAGAFGS